LDVIDQSAAQKESPVSQQTVNQRQSSSAQFHNLKTKQKQSRAQERPPSHRCKAAILIGGMKDNAGVKWLYPGADSQENSQDIKQGKA